MTCARPEGRPWQARSRRRAAGAGCTWVSVSATAPFRSRPRRQPSLRLLPAPCGSMRSGRLRAGWQRSPASACARRLRSLISAIPAGRVSGGPKEVPVAVLAGFVAVGPGV
jgi:hypothetical protein